MSATSNAVNADFTDFYLKSDGKFKTDLRDQQMSGFVEWSAGSPYYEISGTTFNLLSGGTGYIQGDKVTWLGTQSIAGLAVSTYYWFYIDSSGTLNAATTFSEDLITDNILIAEGFRDSSGAATRLVAAAYPYGYPGLARNYQRNTLPSVFGANGIALKLTPTFNNRFEFVEDYKLYTHGIVSDLDSGASITWYIIFKNASSDWTFYGDAIALDARYVNAGANTVCSAGFYGLYRLKVARGSEEGDYKAFAVIHTAQYATLTEVYQAIANGIADTDDVYDDAELANIGYAICEKDTGDVIIIHDADIDRGHLIGTSDVLSAKFSLVDTGDFENLLSSDDVIVQQALQTIDDNWNVKAYTEPGSYAYSVLETDYLVAVDATAAPRSIILPSAPATGQMFVIKDAVGNAATNNIEVSVSGGAINIDGATTYVMNTDWASITLMFNGTKYLVI